MVQPVADPLGDIFDNADKLDAVAFFIGIGASFYQAFVGKRIPQVAMILIGEKLAMLDLRQVVKDLIIKPLPLSLLKLVEVDPQGMFVLPSTA